MSRPVGRRGVSFSFRLIIFSLVLLHAVASAGSERDVKVPAAARAPAEFRVGPGDVLKIDVWREQEVSSSVIVRPDGVISLPLAKDLKVDGLTAIEIQKLVTDRLSQFLTSPDVTVVVQQINSKKIYVVGEVKKPGPVPLLAPMTVVQALSEAGGPTEYASTKEILILRTQEGKTNRFRFNYKAFLKGEAQEQNIALMPGDTIVIR